MRRRIVLFQFTLLAGLLLTGCWSLKSARGRDCFDLRSLRYNPNELVSPISLQGFGPQQPVVLGADKTNADQTKISGNGSLTIWINRKLEENLKVGQTTLAESITIMGEPQEVSYAPDAVTSVYRYQEEFDKGYYSALSCFLRKIRTRGEFSYVVTITFKSKIAAAARSDTATSGTTHVTPASAVLEDLGGDQDINAEPKTLVGPKLLGNQAAMPKLNPTQTKFQELVVNSYLVLVLWNDANRDDKFDPLSAGKKVGDSAGNAAKKAAGL